MAVSLVAGSACDVASAAAHRPVTDERREPASAVRHGLQVDLGIMLAMFIAGAGGFAWMVDILFKMKTQLGFMRVQLAAVQVLLDDTLG